MKTKTEQRAQVVEFAKELAQQVYFSEELKSHVVVFKANTLVLTERTGTFIAGFVTYRGGKIPTENWEAFLTDYRECAQMGCVLDGGMHAYNSEFATGGNHDWIQPEVLNVLRDLKYWDQKKAAC